MVSPWSLLIGSPMRSAHKAIDTASQNFRLMSRQSPDQPWVINTARTSIDLFFGCQIASCRPARNRLRLHHLLTSRQPPFWRQIELITFWRFGVNPCEIAMLIFFEDRGSSARTPSRSHSPVSDGPHSTTADPQPAHFLRLWTRKEHEQLGGYAATAARAAGRGCKHIGTTMSTGAFAARECPGPFPLRRRASAAPVPRPRDARRGTS